MSSLLYIDDRLLGEYGGEAPQHLNNPFSRSKIAIHWAVRLFVGLGYFFKFNEVRFRSYSNHDFSGNVG